jgi:hypothetical protein
MRDGRMIICCFECQVDFQEQEQIYHQPIKSPISARCLSIRPSRFASPIASDLSRDHAFDEKADGSIPWKGNLVVQTDLVNTFARVRNFNAATSFCIVTAVHEHTNHDTRVRPASETAVKPAALRQLDTHHVRLLDVPAWSV